VIKDMQNKKRQADLPIDEPTHLGPRIDALMGDDNAPKELGDLGHELYPTLNPFHYDENILISNRKKSESQGDREARLARRLLDLLNGIIEQQG
jgi:hypothetical protein